MCRHRWDTSSYVGFLAQLACVRLHSCFDSHSTKADLVGLPSSTEGGALRPEPECRNFDVSRPPASHEVALWGFADVCTHALVCATHLRAHTSLKQTGIHMCQSVLVVAPPQAYPEGGVCHHDERRDFALPQPLAPLEVGSKFSESHFPLKILGFTGSLF